MTARIALRPSYALATLLVLSHAGALMLAYAADLPLWCDIAATVAIGASLAWSVCRSALRATAGSVNAIEIGADDVLSVATQRDGWSACDVADDTYVSALITLLNLKVREGGRRVSVVLTPDAVHADDFRRLRVWLRWKQHGKPLARNG